jgi:hypothetical protein
MAAKAKRFFKIVADKTKSVMGVAMVDATLIN